MIRLAALLTLRDVSTAPLRAVAVAVLLAVAGALPIALSAPASAGLVVAAVLAATTTMAALAAHERREATLELNGGGAAVSVMMSTASMVVPGVAATLVVWAASAMSTGAPGALSTVGVCLIVPLVVAAVIPGAGRVRAWVLSRRWSKVLWVLVPIGAAVLFPLVLAAALPLALAAVGRVIGREGPVAHALTALGAAVLALLIALFVGQSSGWFDLAITLFFLGPVLTVCAAHLGTAGLDLTGGAVSRIGPRARLATAPLRGRRRLLGPVAGVLAVVATLAAMDGTVGASFERREERRRTTTVDYQARAGSGPQQAIASVTAADPAAVRLVAADVARRRGVEAIVIDGLGELTSSGFLTVGPTVALIDDKDPQGPTWIGVIEPAGLVGAAATSRPSPWSSRPRSSSGCWCSRWWPPASRH